MIPIFTIQGFTEDLDNETGTELLYREVIRKFASLEITTLWPLPWNCNTDGLAGFCLRQGFSRIIVVAYSWGAGYAAQKLARECDKLGIRIKLMLLCDPVYRPLWMPPWMGAFPLAFRALCKNTKIKITQNVDRVAWVRQRKTLPMGHDLVAEIPQRTKILKGKELQHPHSVIDSSSEWYELVRTELNQTLYPK